MSATAQISSCATTSCAFNQGGCTALAITIAGAEKATCITLATLDARSSGPAEGKVGACHRLECVHNENLACGNEAVSIVGDNAECASYEVA